MFKIPDRIDTVDQNFQIKFKKFKKNWLCSWEEKPDKMVSQKITPESIVRATTKTSDRINRISTVNPGYAIKKTAISRHPVGKLETKYSKYPVFIDKSKVKKANMNFHSSKKTHSSKTSSIQALGQRQKYKRKRNACHEKLRNGEDYKNSSSSENETVSKTRTRNHIIGDITNCAKRTEKVSSKNMKQQSSFHLRSPKLFRSNADKPDAVDNFVQSTVTITNDFQVESSGFTSSDGSFSFRKIKWRSRSVMTQKAKNYRRNQNPLRNNNSHTYSSRVQDHRSISKQSDINSCLPPSNHLKKDVYMFSDDSENSLSFSSKYNEQVSARRSNAFVGKKWANSDVEMEIDGCSAFETKPQNSTGGSNFMLEYVDEKIQNRHSPGLDFRRRLSSERKISTQWYNIPDSLESSLSSSREKLIQIKSFF